ncbi:hypothetical protein ALO45_102117 [Pseudomonas syringae pv. syringae]|nr:hypothetical protein ALO45_102117 [Pseudomonas syringae pv. syringae]
MAVISFSVIRYVDPFQGGGILLENHREYKVPLNCIQPAPRRPAQKNRAHGPVSLFSRSPLSE